MENKLSPLLLIVLITLTAVAKESKYIKLAEKIPLPNVKGRIDHLAIDLKNKRLFAAALGNNTVEVIDLNIGRKVHTIKGLNEPQGVIYIPQDNIIYISNGGSGECSIFDVNSFKLINSIKLGDDADNMRYDPNANLIYVGYGNGAIGIIDGAARKQINDIMLPGHPEAFELEKNSSKIFVNIPATRQIAVIDRQNLVVERFIDIKDARENFPMALDETNHRLFVGCRRPARLIIFDTQSETEVYHLDIDKDADDIFLDSTNKRIYVSCGSGFIDIIQQTSDSEYNLIEQFPTEPGARTSLFVPELQIIFLAVPAKWNRPAEIQNYKIK